MKHSKDITQIKFYFDSDHGHDNSSVASLQISSDQQKIRLGCLLDRELVRKEPFTYSIPENFKNNEKKLERYNRLLQISRNSFSVNKPRVTFPGDILNLDANTSLDVFSMVANLVSDKADIVFMPTRTRNTRRLTGILFDLLQSAPDVLVLGMGFQDYLVDINSSQSQVDLDEFSNRLKWMLEVVVKDFNTGVVFILAPPKGETVHEKNNLLLSAEAAQSYMQTARKLVEEYGQTIVDYENHYSGTKIHIINRLAEVTADKIRNSLSEASLITIPSFRKLNGTESISENIYADTPYQANPVIAEIISKDQSRIRYTGNQIEKLLFSLSSKAKVESDADEGSGLGSGKTLGNIGGRSEFEKSLQRSIILNLQQSHRPERKKTMIIGDSIRMRIADATGYGLHTYENLKNHTNIVHIPHNCGSTVSTLHYLDDWLSCSPQIVHINVGLHDLVFGLDGQTPESYIPVEKYQENVGKILQRIQNAGVEVVIWGLNTPVWEERHNNQDKSLGKVRRRLGRRNADVRLYNEAAMSAAGSLCVPVTDMFTPLWEQGVEKTLVADGVHLNHHGAKMLGELVAGVVIEYL